MRIALYICISLFLAGASSFIYFIQNSIFHSPRDSGFYFFQDLAFLPVQILLGVLIIDNLVRFRERKKLLQKMNMVIGVFFIEAGSELLSIFVSMTGNISLFRKSLLADGTWDRKKFTSAAENISAVSADINAEASTLEILKSHLSGKRECILRLLENPNLLEHDRFTDLLWAVSHLAEELHRRDSVHSLPPHDIEHLKGDILRAYRLLIIEWLSYIQHLKEQYPYLYSLAVRTNPFNPDAKVEIA